MESPMSGGCWRNWTVPGHREVCELEWPPARQSPGKALRLGLGSAAPPADQPATAALPGASPPIRPESRRRAGPVSAPVRQCRGAKRGREAAYSGLGAGTGWLRLPDGKALTGFNHEYKRLGTSTLFAALEVATGQVKVGHFQRRRRRDFLAFMNQLVVAYP